MTAYAPVDSDLMERLRAAYADKLYLTRRELAPVLRMAPETLGRLEAAGEIASRRKGVGKVRPRRVYAFEDVVKAKFLKAEVACQPTSRPARSSTSTTSGAEVVVFSERRALRQKEKQPS